MATIDQGGRAGSAPPTRGREGFEKPMPLPTGKTKTSPKKSRPIGIPPATPDRKSKTKSGVKRPIRIVRRDPSTDSCSLAMSRTESVLVSSAGDVIVCRCRRSSTPYMSLTRGDVMMDPWSNLIPCCDTDIVSSIEGPWSPVFERMTIKEHTATENTSQTSEVSTYEWEKMDKPMPKKKNGLNGGGSGPRTEEAKPLISSGTARPVPKTPTEENLMDFNAYDGGLLPLPSFDYSHIHEGHNDMVPQNSENMVGMGSPSTRNRRKKQPIFPTILESPEEKKDEDHSPQNQTTPQNQRFFHGVPSCLQTLSQIRIKKVSAHPMGAHVLLISEEAMLFSYGLNNHGQLGIGIKSRLSDATRGFHTTPTLITPLLENGGKAINCAAGVDHSLVVIATEGRRLQKLNKNPHVAYSEHGALTLARATSSPSRFSIDDCDDDKHRLDAHDAVRHHQIYGFGSNDFMKIGLVSARLADDGAEGDVEDILLPRRVALHCTVWPHKDASHPLSRDSDYPPHGVFDIAASAEHSAALVRRATGDIELYTWGNATLGALGLPILKDPDVKIQGGLTRRPTSTANNIFPMPTVVESMSYRPTHEGSWGFPRELSLGPYSSFVVMSTGRCLSFGFSAEGMLGHGYGVTHSMEPKEVLFPVENGTKKGLRIVAVSAGAYHAVALCENGHAFSWGLNSDDRLGLGTNELMKVATIANADVSREDLVDIQWLPQKIDIDSHATLTCPSSSEDSKHVVKACAGYDSSMIVVRSGQVLCFGKRSGRLGKGEVRKDVSVPEPMHGGLRLFQNTPPSQATIRPSTIRRQQSDGVFATSGLF